MEPSIKCSNCGKEHERRSLKCPFCDYINIPKLYKYLPYNDNSLAILINKEIWCPKAGAVNDPLNEQ